MTEPQKDEVYRALLDKELSAETKREILTKLGFPPETSRLAAGSALGNLWLAKTPDSKSKIQDAYNVLQQKKMSNYIPPSMKRHHAIQKKPTQQDVNQAIHEARRLQFQKAKREEGPGETKTISTSASHDVPNLQYQLPNLQYQLLLENLDNDQLWINMIQLANTNYHEKVNKKDKASLDILKGQTNHGTVAENKAYEAIVANLTNQDEKDAAVKKYKEKLAEYAKLNGIQKTNAYLLDVVSTDEFTTLPSPNKQEIAKALLLVKEIMNGGRKKRKTKKRKGGKKKRKTRKKRGGKSRRRKHRKKYRKQKTKRRRTYRKTRKKTKRRR